MTSGPREAESLSDPNGASKGSVDCQQTTRETAVQSSVKGWIFSLRFFFFFFFFLLAYASTQRSSPNPPGVGVGKVVCFPGPQKFQLICLIEKESVVSGMKSLGLREKSLDPFHAKQRRIPGKPRGISKWETILPPKSQPRKGFTTEKKFLLSCK